MTQAPLSNLRSQRRPYTCLPFSSETMVNLALQMSLSNKSGISDRGNAMKIPNYH